MAFTTEIHVGSTITGGMMYMVFKQGLHRTRKLRQFSNCKVNLRICELAKTSNKENWSIQQVFLADPFR